VRFEILGDIEDVHRIAAGPNVRVRALLRKAYGAGARRRGLQWSGWRMVKFGELSYIGMKRTGLADVTSRSRAT
jgi:hypothetical protein